MSAPRIAVIIPALNEAASIGHVIGDIPAELHARVIVVDNGSTDSTAVAARSAGGIVIDEQRRGYGQACLAALAHLRQQTPAPDIVVFLDGDYSDYPEDMRALVAPITDGEADFVVGSRVSGHRMPGALTVQQRVGNWLATRLIRIFFGARFTDLGPFRAIRYASLLALNMQDRDYGWTVEMQIKSVRRKLRMREVPVRYRKRIGQSKISGTVKGTILAGYKILLTVFRYI